MSKRKSSAANAVGVPAAAMGGCARIEFAGNREATVDGCRGVAEYGDTLIRLNVAGGSVCFTGTELQISCLYDNEATITGNICNMEFCL